MEEENRNMKSKAKSYFNLETLDTPTVTITSIISKIKNRNE